MKQGCSDSTADGQMCSWSPDTRRGWRDPSRSSRCLRDNHLHRPPAGLLLDSRPVNVLDVYFRLSQKEIHRLQTGLTRQPRWESKCSLVSSRAGVFSFWIVGILLQCSSASSSLVWSWMTRKGPNAGSTDSICAVSKGCACLLLTLASDLCLNLPFRWLLSPSVTVQPCPLYLALNIFSFLLSFTPCWTNYPTLLCCSRAVDTRVVIPWWFFQMRISSVWDQHLNCFQISIFRGLQGVLFHTLGQSMAAAAASAVCHSFTRWK